MSDLLDLGRTLAVGVQSALASPDLDFRVGRIISWNSNTQSNRVEVFGVIMTNLPVLTSAGTVGLSNDVLVGVLKVRTQYFILGRIVNQSSGLVNPQFPIILYPQFITNGTAGTIGQWRVNTGILASWEGRLRPHFPYIEVDGVWGNVSGSGSTTYALKLGGTTVGSWVETTLNVGRHGPYDVSAFVGQDWLKIELVITASTGTGEKAIQPLGCYFRDTL